MNLAIKRHHLTPEETEQVRKSYDEGIPVATLAAQYDVTKTTIFGALTGIRGTTPISSRLKPAGGDHRS